MGNSYRKQFLFSKHNMLTMCTGDFTLGASGAVAGSTGADTLAVTKLGTGIYQIQLKENFNALVGAQFLVESPLTGSPVADGSFVATTLYQITVVGTTNWAAIGFPAGIAPAVGGVFVATGVGGAGTGTATAIGKSAIVAVEACQNLQSMLVSNTPGQGSVVVVQTLNTSDANASPASGSVIRFVLMFRNSSVPF